MDKLYNSMDLYLIQDLLESSSSQLLSLSRVAYQVQWYTLSKVSGISVPATEGMYHSVLSIVAQL